jgi:hypothetical protein
VRHPASYDESKSVQITALEPLACPGGSSPPSSSSMGRLFSLKPYVGRYRCDSDSWSQGMVRHPPMHAPTGPSTSRTWSMLRVLNLSTAALTSADVRLSSAAVCGAAMYAESMAGERPWLLRVARNPRSSPAR